MADDLAELAAQAYIYGFPLVFDLEQVDRLTTVGLGATPATPFNRLGHARVLAGPDDTFVSINNDTLYTMGQLDLGGGPLRLTVPDTAGRYYVLQFVDAWTDNFAYVGHRATGTGAGEFLIVPPGWAGDAPAEATVIRSPTRIASIVGRWACAGVDDMPAVHALQDATTLAPVDEAAAGGAEGLPIPDPGVPDELAFFEKLRVWSQAFPPPARDRDLQAGLAPLGLDAAGSSPYVDPDPALAAALTAGLAAGRERLEAAVAGAGRLVNGWNVSLHAFDYNLDHFEVGTLDTDEWRLPEAARLVARAGAARAGLWGNHAYEAAYVMTYLDDRGDRLTGERSYTLRLSPPPPVGAFWSVTMYDLPEFYLVANEIDRYSVGDRTPGLVTDDDGGVTITISHARPGDERAVANWLPAPAGEFRPILRMYEPDEPVLDGSYTIPAITRV